MDPEDELEDADSSEDDELLCELDVFMSHNVLTAKSEKVRSATTRSLATLHASPDLATALLQFHPSYHAFLIVP